MFFAQEALSAFNEAINRLRGSANPNSETSNAAFIDAYEAEGLLGVCLFIIKHVPVGFLLPDWPIYFSTFDMYLSHPASTVRQATSNLFKFLGSCGEFASSVQILK